MNLEFCLAICKGKAKILKLTALLYPRFVLTSPDEAFIVFLPSYFCFFDACQRAISFAIEGI
jgi:hypothetical protein